MLVIEKDIILRINKGDIKAFEKLYSVFYVYLCAIAIKYIYNVETAKEIVNDVFLNVWNHRQSLVFPIHNYLVKSVKNACLNHLRQKRLQEIPLTDIQENLLLIREQLINSDPHPLSLLENKEFKEEVYKALNTLPEKCRDIFIQHLYQNKTYEEIAKTNKISSSTVRVQIKIGLSKLRDLVRHLAIPIACLCFFL